MAITCFSCRECPWSCNGSDDATLQRPLHHHGKAQLSIRWVLKSHFPRVNTFYYFNCTHKVWTTMNDMCLIWDLLHCQSPINLFLKSLISILTISSREWRSLEVYTSVVCIFCTKIRIVPDLWNSRSIVVTEPVECLLRNISF